MNGYDNLDIKVEPYAYLVLFESDMKPDGIHSNCDTRRVVREYDMPREQYFRRQRTLHWITCRFQYYHPRRHYSLEVSFYDKKTGLALSVKTALAELSSCKGQVTKMQNRIQQYADKWQPTLLIQTIQEDPAYKKALETLSKKIFELNEAETRLQTEIQQLKEAKQLQL